MPSQLSLLPRLTCPSGRAGQRQGKAADSRTAPAVWAPTKGSHMDSPGWGLPRVEPERARSRRGGRQRTPARLQLGHRVGVGGADKGRCSGWTHRARAKVTGHGLRAPPCAEAEALTLLLVVVLPGPCCSQAGCSVVGSAGHLRRTQRQQF